jgi:hypothetical protein
MPFSLQSKILRFLEQGEVQRLGGNDNLKVDVRVIAATNADLKKRVAQQQFREDLYYRLAVFPIHLPPLRDRMSDLEDLAIAFAAKIPSRGLHLARSVAGPAQHGWPGTSASCAMRLNAQQSSLGSGTKSSLNTLFCRNISAYSPIWASIPSLALSCMSDRQMLPSSHAVPINQLGVDSIPSPQLLADAFSEFISASSFSRLPIAISSRKLRVSAWNSPSAMPLSPAAWPRTTACGQRCSRCSIRCRAACLY